MEFFFVYLFVFRVLLVLLLFLFWVSLVCRALPPSKLPPLLLLFFSPLPLPLLPLLLLDELKVFTTSSHVLLPLLLLPLLLLPLVILQNVGNNFRKNSHLHNHLKTIFLLLVYYVYIKKNYFFRVLRDLRDLRLRRDLPPRRESVNCVMALNSFFLADSDKRAQNPLNKNLK